jgi:hypothetical protein
LKTWNSTEPRPQGIFSSQAACQTGNGTDIERDGDLALEANAADELAKALMEAFASLLAIGWKFIFRGALSMKWATTFACDGKGDNIIHAGQWTRVAIKRSWNIAEDAWKARNGKFHGEDPDENGRKQRRISDRRSRKLLRLPWHHFTVGTGEGDSRKTDSRGQF